jgi:cell division protein FtsW (lipid II flippase)
VINREIIIWAGIIFIFNPILTHFLFARRARVNNKGKIVIYSITTMIALFWCGISTRYFLFSIIAGLYFAALIVFKNSFFKNIRQDYEKKHA